MSEPIKFSEHPDYAAKKGTWQRHSNLFRGDHATLTGPEYLWRHQFELKADFADYLAQRLERTRYLNLMRIVISIWQGYYFKRRPEPDGKLAKMLGPEIDNIDGRGTSLFAFVKKDLLTNFLLYGKTALLIDSLDIPAATAGEERQAGQRPFISCISPLAIRDWQRDIRSPNIWGQYDWLRYEYSEIAKREDGRTAPKEQTICDMLRLSGGAYVIDRYQKKEKDKNAKDEGDGWELLKTLNPHRPSGEALNQIPILVLEEDCSLEDAAEESLRFHNKRSMLDFVDLHQGFKKCFLTGLESLDAAQRKAVTEFAIGILPKGAELLQIEPVDTQSLRSGMADSLDYFFKVGLRQVHTLPADSREAPSAEAQAAARSNATDIVLANIEQLENFINAALRTYAEFKGIKDFDGKLELSREVEFESLQSQLEIFAAMADEMRRLPTWKKETLKRIAQFQNFKDEVMDGIKEEIGSAVVAEPESAPGDQGNGARNIDDELAAEIGAAQ